MKKVYLILILFCFSLSFSQKITFHSHLQAIYSFRFRQDPAQNKISKEVVGLYIGDGQSVFQDERKYKIDSVLASQKYSQLLSMPMFRVNHVIFKNFKNSGITYSERVDKIILGYREPQPDMQWKLIGEKKTILGYECYKAETDFRGRSYTAWYTPAISIPDGPYKFSGLPGLILEVYDDKYHFHYQLLQVINQPKEILYDTDISFTKRKKLSRAQMDNIRKNKKLDVPFNPIEKE
ncbi:GLPGLI family protein [Chryseobacterium sp. CT-SW4]|uniref:GLPGLI family protein n=1 Tax=Chryseobacterium sp. SW-1 TaxID=3157343 RepID=UPI003B027FD5